MPGSLSLREYGKETASSPAFDFSENRAPFSIFLPIAVICGKNALFLCTMSDKEKIYTKKEEWLNIISHAAGIVAAVVVGLYFLYKVIDKNGDAVDLMSMILYMSGMLASFVCSTAYHSAKPGTSARRILRKFDHSAIYW